MPEWLQQAFSVPSLPIATLVTRLVAALLAGLAVGVIAGRNRRGSPSADKFPATLVLLCVLIAIVTQVIGDNVARAFSLVGALAIVRFRTVVQDTQDTVFVIFAVVEGMAIGSGQLLVALFGIGIVVLTTFVVRWTPGSKNDSYAEASLTVRVGLHANSQELLAVPFDKHLQDHRLVTAETVRGGSAFSLTYCVRQRPGMEPIALIAELHRVDGVEAVSWDQRASDQQAS